MHKIHLVQIFVHLAILIFSLKTNAYKNPTGIRLDLSNHYGPPQRPGYNYYNKYGPPPYCEIDFRPDIISTPGVNDDRPYYDCRFTFSGVPGSFLRANGTYHPCIEPELIGTVKVGESLKNELTIIKGVQQSVAAIFPATTPNSLPFTMGFVSEGIVILKNTTVSFDLPMNLQYNQAVKRKIEMRKKDTKLYYETQVDQAKSIFSTLSSLEEKDEEETYFSNLHRPAEERLYSASSITSFVQTFSPIITEITVENKFERDRDLIETEEVFGLPGARFEFQDSDKVANSIYNMIHFGNESKVNLRVLGASPLSASANTMNMFSSYIQFAQTVSFNFDSSVIADNPNIDTDSPVDSTLPTPPGCQINLAGGGDVSVTSFAAPPAPTRGRPLSVGYRGYNRYTGGGMNMGWHGGRGQICGARYCQQSRPIG